MQFDRTQSYYFYLSLIKQFQQFKSGDDLGDNFLGDNYTKFINSAVEESGDVYLDSMDYYSDVITPFIDSFKARGLLWVDKIDDFDYKTFGIAYYTLFVNPIALLANGISNMILRNINGYHREFKDNIRDVDVQRIDAISQNVKIGEEFIYGLYFADRIVENIIMYGREFGVIDTHINNTSFNDFKNINIYLDSNTFRSEIIWDTVSKIDGVLDLISGEVKRMMRSALSTTIIENDLTLSYIL